MDSESFYAKMYHDALRRHHIVNCGLIWNVFASLGIAWWAPGHEWQFAMVLMAAFNGGMLWHLNRTNSSKP